MGGHGGTPAATGGQYRPTTSSPKAPEFSLQGPIEIGALRYSLSEAQLSEAASQPIQKLRMSTDQLDSSDLELQNPLSQR